MTDSFAPILVLAVVFWSMATIKADPTMNIKVGITSGLPEPGAACTDKEKSTILASMGDYLLAQEEGAQHLAADHRHMEWCNELCFPASSGFCEVIIARCKGLHSRRALRASMVGVDTNRLIPGREVVAAATTDGGGVRMRFKDEVLMIAKRQSAPRSRKTF
jgi:hypothetical protein